MMSHQDKDNTNRLNHDDKFSIKCPHCGSLGMLPNEAIFYDEEGIMEILGTCPICGRLFQAVFSLDLTQKVKEEPIEETPQWVRELLEDINPNDPFTDS